jgi:serine/threonine protein kinase
MTDNTMTRGTGGGGGGTLSDLTELGGFELKEKLGEGGQGMVFRGVKPLANLEAAVKVIFRRRNDPNTVIRFMREVSMAVRLQHPYAARIYQCGSTANALWVAMEFVHGKGLDRLLKEQGALPVDQAVVLLEQVAEVVNYAHEQGMVHRDLKPANVMVADDGTPKLLDFGIAKAVSSGYEVTGADVSKLPSATDQLTSRSGVVVGSPPYMSPESWTNPANVDLHADLYALGVMTYELLMGERPFRANDAAEMMNHHLFTPIPPLRGFPTEIGEVIHRAMAKDPTMRFDSAPAFVAELRRVSARYLDKG